jgi:hypothetical protein
MKTIVIGFADTFIGLADRFWIEILSSRYNVIRNDKDPQILIFGDENFGKSNEQYDPQKVFKLFYTGENRRFWNYKCHAGITFDHIDDERHYRLPLYVPSIWEFQKDFNYPDLDNNLLQVKEKTSFCSFINRNAQCQRRNQFFSKLSEYKKVDAGGPVFNNTPMVGPLRKDKIDYLSTRKFNICFENGSHPGYATEKIMDAFYAKTIPIYWGSPTIEIDFNPDAFLNWHDYLDDDLFIKRIIELDTNDELYYDMINQPPFRNNKKNKFMDMNRLLDWFENNVVGRIGL